MNKKYGISIEYRTGLVLAVFMAAVVAAWADGKRDRSSPKNKFVHAYKCDNGYPHYCLWLAKIYEGGWGVAKSTAKAKHYYQKAIRECEKILADKTSGGHSHAHLTLGEAYAGMGKHEKAVGYFKKVLAIYPKSGEMDTGYGKCPVTSREGLGRLGGRITLTGKEYEQKPFGQENGHAGTCD